MERENLGDCFTKPNFTVEVPSSWVTTEASCSRASFTSPDQKAYATVQISVVPIETDTIDTLLRILPAVFRESKYERDGNMVTVKALSAEVVDHDDKKAFLQHQTTTVEHPSEEFCNATGHLLFIPIKLRLRGSQLAVGLEGQRCLEFPQHDPTLEKILDSLRVLRDE